jgi:NAD(P)H-hydrate epimerase
VNARTERLHRAAALRELERRACTGQGLTPGELMERAGAASFEVLTGRWPAARRVSVICGGGNNGGDGYVLARLARAAGLDVSVFTVGAGREPPAAAAAAAGRYRDAGGAVRPFAGGLPAGCDVAVDALFGIGLDREVRGDAAAAIAALNGAGVPVLALDVPSGLDADTGAVRGVAVRAAVTVSFLAQKPGLFTGAGPEYARHVVFADLGVEPAIAADLAPDACLVRHGTRPFPLPPRARDAHKGAFGHVLVVGGDAGFAGAPIMAGEAALRTGAGLVSVATRPAHGALAAALRPELMVHGIAAAADLEPLLRRATVIAAGPGLGQSDWAVAFLACVLDTRVPLVLDADALNLLARDPVRRAGWILTPHPGEAARLLGATTRDVQGDRLGAAQALVEKYGGVAVLKGAGTVVAGGGNRCPAICGDGNPGMASGGMGDVLTGVIAALCAQGVPAREAAETGVCLHAAAADRAAADGERGIVATDLMPWLRRLANPAP